MTVKEFGATKELTARVWGGMLLQMDNTDTWVPNYILSNAAPDYLRQLIHDAHTQFNLAMTDDWTMFFVHHALGMIEKGTPADQFPLFTAGEVIGLFDDANRKSLLSEWLNMDPARYGIVDTTEGIYGMPSGDDKLVVMLEDAANWELRQVYNLCVDAIDLYLATIRST